MNAETSWLAELNADTDTPTLVADLQACCGARSWVEAVLAGRPYNDVDELYEVSDAATFGLDNEGLAQALAVHPRIGARVAADPHAAWSRQEQAGMSGADTSVREQMAEANRRYEAKFGQVYLVCASGLSAPQLLDLCCDRLNNDVETERVVVLGELAKIARIRLTKLMDGAAG
jgi:2-oxo-4-hydroxy-4-carboxy-5-ureidoimidazoline decarboxylase